MNPNLPVIQGEKMMIEQKNKIKLDDLIRKLRNGIGRIALGSIGLAGGIGLTVAFPALGAIPFVLNTASLVYAGKGALEFFNNTEPGLIFYSKKNKDGSIGIYQDSMQLPSYLRGISNIDRANIMGLQVLIGTERHKVKLEKSGEPLVKSNGKRVYGQVYNTITHSINIKNLEALEKAGYIEIVKKEKEFNLYDFEKALGIKKKAHRSDLLMEKIGFSNIEGVKQILKARLSGNPQKIRETECDFEKIYFRLTDKHFNFKDMYEKINGYKPYDNLEEKKNLSRFRSIFFDSNDLIPGVLSGRREQNIKYEKVNPKTGEKESTHKKAYFDRKKKIDIKYDKYGRPFLDYFSNGKSFGEKIEEEHNIEKIDRNIKKADKKQSSRDKFIEELRFNTSERGNNYNIEKRMGSFEKKYQSDGRERL